MWGIDRAAVFSTFCRHEFAYNPCVLRRLHPLAEPTDQPDLAMRSRAKVLVCLKSLRPPAYSDSDRHASMPQILTTVIEVLQKEQHSPKRTHIFLLTPRYANLTSFEVQHPLVHVHQINPARVPFPLPGRDGILFEDCPTAVDFDYYDCPTTPFSEHSMTNNFDSYDSPSSRIQRILNFARYEKPLGTIYGLSVQFVTKPGCRIIIKAKDGSENVRLRSLQLGQKRTCFVDVEIHLDEFQLPKSKTPWSTERDPVQLKGDDGHLSPGGDISELFSLRVWYHHTVLPSHVYAMFHKPFLVEKRNNRLVLGGKHSPVSFSKRFAFHFGRYFDRDSAKDVLQEMIMDATGGDPEIYALEKTILEIVHQTEVLSKRSKRVISGEACSHSVHIDDEKWHPEPFLPPSFPPPEPILPFRPSPSHVESTRRVLDQRTVSRTNSVLHAHKRHAAVDFGSRSFSAPEGSGPVSRSGTGTPNTVIRITEEAEEPDQARSVWKRMARQWGPSRSERGVPEDAESLLANDAHARELHGWAVENRREVGVESLMDMAAYRRLQEE
ncbi:hypothetical protein GQ43DRAFT_476002 [Delitschia confertaspora ATCC 74209]|uniref:Uncharacterized protein n=1 Tax=Delitschia confertaspora ATCC 74209 TaxID=1513339 RepID=A0A9P4JCK9_9PLEO|nr:hypothetical protein GQ43DRAFT_476002 [Delitschia confertaspora ATCC 74209]